MSCAFCGGSEVLYDLRPGWEMRETCTSCGLVGENLLAWVHEEEETDGHEPNVPELQAQLNAVRNRQAQPAPVVHAPKRADPPGVPVRATRTAPVPGTVPTLPGTEPGLAG